VADALAYAHSLGVVHRDIKPANLLIDQAGTIWISDFGLARLETAATLTGRGDLLGTLRYMSPELAGGDHTAVNARTDIYALGVTLYELLTLEPVFDGANREQLLRQIHDQEPRPPRRLNPAIPADLETIVLKAMSKDPASRYATAQDLAEDLRRFLEHKPILARRPTIAERAGKWARRHVALISIGATALAVAKISLLIAALMTLGAYRSEADQRSKAVANLRVAADSIDRM
jgi:serine/threonine protein kinase